MPKKELNKTEDFEYIDNKGDKLFGQTLSR